MSQIQVKASTVVHHPRGDVAAGTLLIVSAKDDHGFYCEHPDGGSVYLANEDASPMFVGPTGLGILDYLRV